MREAFNAQLKKIHTREIGSTFRGCILGKLEGPGITKSECPICHQPAWKKDLRPNQKYTNLANIFRAHLQAADAPAGGSLLCFSHLCLSEGKQVILGRKQGLGFAMKRVKHPREVH